MIAFINVLQFLKNSLKRLNKRMVFMLFVNLKNSVKLEEEAAATRRRSRSKNAQSRTDPFYRPFCSFCEKPTQCAKLSYSNVVFFFQVQKLQFTSNQKPWTRRYSKKARNSKESMLPLKLLFLSSAFAQIGIVNCKITVRVGFTEVLMENCFKT